MKIGKTGESLISSGLLVFDKPLNNNLRINILYKNVDEINKQFEGKIADTNTERRAIPRSHTLAGDTQKLTNAIEGRTTLAEQLFT